MLTEKDYCDYETRNELIKLGYPAHLYDNTEVDKILGAILLYEAQKWLREEKNIDISVTISPFEYFATIREFVFWRGEYSWKTPPIYPNGAKTYEEALSEGVREAVKILKEE